MKINQKKLFFIIAPPRTGTTLLQEIMNTFSGFCNTEESRIAGPNSISCWQYVKIDEDFSYLEKFIEKNWTKEFFVEKSPPSILCLAKILRRYPDANYIFLKRDPKMILQSILNMFFGISQIGRRKSDLRGLFDKDKTILDFEEVRARQLLKMIKYQVRYKEEFQNKCTVKYEELIKSLDSCLTILEKTFNIKANSSQAHKKLGKPSESSNFRYWYDDLSNEKAISMINLARQLWDYN